ncbi:hypothetical protein KA001_03420 [Patescibacteria group bacterium]|nr:hypothetical protein [Patescibacteria group bacterium]
METIKTLLIWEGPQRPYKKVDRKYYTSMIGIGIALFLFLIFAGQFILIIVLLSMLFTTYALFAVAPGNATYAITTAGLEIQGELVPWEQILNFFTEKRLDVTIISLNVKTTSLSRVKYLIPDNETTLIEAIKIIESKVPRYAPKSDTNLIAKLIERIGLSIKE